MNIVIIDDDIFVSGALKTILEASGDITVSATGTDGKGRSISCQIKCLRTERKCAMVSVFSHPRTQTVSEYADIPEVSDLTRFHLKSHTHHASDRFPSPFQSPSTPRHVRSGCEANKKLPHGSCFAQIFSSISS